ncbi:uncharacterized protein LOC114331895 [Diabrotica virgifera virgifera]|uniref:Uncharacterized protein LOC114331895 n=1 Tax=Diabrotica virgifera virgifera TaxID=50390 RepID=A0A6P7FMA8_DIAVI|nr:uncharacterized protein LOC114331895 [Diabrotica virgifera virgifera]
MIMYKEILLIVVIFANLHHGESFVPFLGLIRDGISTVYNGVDCGLYKLESWIRNEPTPCNFEFFGSSKQNKNNRVHHEDVPPKQKYAREKGYYEESDSEEETDRKGKFYHLEDEQKVQPQEKYHGKALRVGEKKYIVLKEKKMDDSNSPADYDDESEEQELVETLNKVIEQEDNKKEEKFKIEKYKIDFLTPSPKEKIKKKRRS